MELFVHRLPEAIVALALWWLPPLIPVGVSAVYFWASPKCQPLWLRLLASSHGLSIAVLYAGSWWVYQSGNAHPGYRLGFLLPASIPVALIIASLGLFRGNRALHLLHFLTLPSWAWTVFVGGMAVTGDWL